MYRLGLRSLKFLHHFDKSQLLECHLEDLGLRLWQNHVSVMFSSLLGNHFHLPDLLVPQYCTWSSLTVLTSYEYQNRTKNHYVSPCSFMGAANIEENPSLPDPVLSRKPYNGVSVSHALAKLSQTPPLLLPKLVIS